MIMSPDSSPTHDDPNPPIVAVPKTLRYEEAIEALEAVIDQIESGEAGLEKSLVFYERGIKLIGHCRSILGATEKKIAELMIDAQGNPRVPPDPTDDPGRRDA